MPTTTRRAVWTDTPNDIVTAYMCDFTTNAQWDPHTLSCLRLDDTGDVGVGARYEKVQKMAGWTSTLRYRVIEYDPGRRIVFDGGNDIVHTRDEITFDQDPLSGRTTVTYTVTVTLLGKARAAQPLLPAVMKKIADDDAAGLRHHLHALTPGSATARPAAEPRRRCSPATASTKVTNSATSSSAR